jgi:hypothetical protein
MYLRVSGIRQRDIHTAEPLVPEPRVFGFEMVSETVEIYRLPGFDQIPAELIKAGGRKIKDKY